MICVSIGSEDEGLIRMVHDILKNDPETGRWNDGGIDWEFDVNVDEGNKIFYSVFCWVDELEKVTRAYVELAIGLAVAQKRMEEAPLKEQMAERPDGILLITKSEAIALLNVLIGIRAGDAKDLDCVAKYLNATSCPAQYVATLRRYQSLAAKITEEMK
jgi:hypothetical protein